MAISKRLRYEILRRDNHACRYCGRAAPDVKLHIDHVVPVSLGGADEPTNLATSCADCNGGKSSVAADAPIVADVEQDALRWARAMEIAAQGRAIERAEAQERYERFYTWWTAWSVGTVNPRVIPIDPDWRSSVDQFLKAGLEMDDIEELVGVAMESKCSADRTWRYFCGCCWRRIEQSHAQAKAIIARWEVEGDG